MARHEEKREPVSHRRIVEDHPRDRGSHDRTPDRGGRGMRDEVDYDRPHGGRDPSKGDFASHGGSADWYEGGHGDPRAYPTARYDERPGGGYARGGGYMDRGASADGYSRHGFGERGYGADGSWRGDAPQGRGRSERDFWERATDEVSSWFGDEEAERRRDRDQHRGKGPRNYARSDERIHEDVNDHLTEDGAIDASAVSVTVSGREVTLDGEVETRAEKRRAEDVADMVPGVTHVQNNLRVRNRHAGGPGGNAI